MKKYLLIIFITLLVCVTGCDNYNFKVGAVSDIVIEDIGVDFSIKEGTLTNRSATVVITNNTDQTISYGYPYAMEIKKDNEWHVIDLELNFIMPAFEISEYQYVEIELNWENAYGALPAGEYRIIKNVSFENSENSFNDYDIAVEFEIE